MRCRKIGIETTRRVGVNRPVAAPWEKRFRRAGLAGLAEAKGCGRKPTIGLETKGEIISQATPPPAGRQRWSVRTMAAAGVSKATVQRLCAEARAPVRLKSWRPSASPTGW